MRTVVFTDITAELEHLFHLPIRLTRYEQPEGTSYDFIIGDWTVVEGKPSYYVKRRMAQLLLDGWTGWDIHHDHTICDADHDGRHNGRRSFQEEYASEGQLYGLVIQRAELRPLSCALAPVPPHVNRLLTTSVMGSTDLLSDKLGSVNNPDVPIDPDLFDRFVEVQVPVSMSRLGLDHEQARQLWSDAVDRIELARVIARPSPEEL